MFKKGYFIILLLLFALLGISTQQQNIVPNQEIVLQFTDAEVTDEDIQNAIDLVKNQLQDFGVDDILIKKLSGGVLKITYYSDADVASIRETFSKEEKIAIDFNSHKQIPTNFPSDSNDLAYNLDINEIQHGSDNSGDLNGIIIGFDSKSNRFLEPHSNLFIINPESVKDDILIKQAYKIRRHAVFILNNTSKRIPEVRAGPHC